MSALPERLAHRVRGAIDPVAGPSFRVRLPVLAAGLSVLVAAGVGVGGVAALAAVAPALAALALAARLSHREQELAVARGVVAALDRLGQGVAVSEPATLRIVAVSQAASEVTGRSREKLVGADAVETLDPQEQEMIRERARLRGAGLAPPSRLQAHVGRRSVEVATVDAVVDGHALLVSVARDVSDRRRAEEELATARELLGTVIRSIPAPVRVVDGDGTEMVANVAVDSSVDVGWKAHPLRAPDGSVRCVVMVGNDGRNLAAHEAPDRLASGHERDHAELERLVSIASHDLREPLRAVNGFAELLERESGQDLSDRGREFLTLIRQAGARMDDLLDGLSRFGRAGRETGGGRVDVNLDDALDTVLGALRDEIDARGASVTRDELPVVRADPTGVQQVLEQLIGNALKFNHAPSPHVHVAACDRDEGWELTVVDDGIGVPERERDRVFEMYRRLHPRDAYPGNGVGLAVARRIVHRHGGRIWIDDAPAGGSAVHVLIPAGGGSGS